MGCGNMEMISMSAVKAIYREGYIHMLWELPDKISKAIHIYEVQRNNDNSHSLLTHTHMMLNLKKNQTQFSFPVVANTHVSLREYCVYLSKLKKHEPSIKTLKSMGGVFVEVVVGNANIFAEVVLKKKDTGKDDAFLILKSNAPVAQGLVGYTYTFDEVEYIIPLPDEIPAKKITLQLEWLGGTKPDVIILNDKPSEVKIIKYRMNLLEHLERYIVTALEVVASLIDRFASKISDLINKNETVSQESDEDDEESQQS